MIARAAKPLIPDDVRLFTAALVAERLLDHLRSRATLCAQPRDGQWAHFIDSAGGIRSELRP